jgi:hypothetical protein
MFKFVAKPKLTNRLDEQEFVNENPKLAAMAAVEFLNDYNKLGKKFEDKNGQYVPALKGEDWVMVGKLSLPEGLYFRDNNLKGL